MQTWLDVKDAEIIIQLIKSMKNTFVADVKKFQKARSSLSIMNMTKTKFKSIVKSDAELFKFLDELKSFPQLT